MNDKRAFVRALFARIAPRYDVMNRLMTFGQDQRWRERAAHIALEPTAPAPLALDLATGTGDLARALTRIKPAARVVALDLTREMLTHAQTKQGAGTKPAPTTFVNADALDLPFPANTFDALTSAFMLRNVVDLDRAFAEMTRVARPHARIVALEITAPRLPIWRTLYRFYFYRLVPLLGALVSGDLPAYRYLPQSLSEFISPADLATVMTRAGLSDVHYLLLNLGTVAIHWGTK